MADSGDGALVLLRRFTAQTNDYTTAAQCGDIISFIMKASEKAYSLIRQSEGLRLTAYRCPAGVWTIGYGHTSGVTEGMTISVEQAEEFLRQDIEAAEGISASPRF